MGTIFTEKVRNPKGTNPGDRWINIKQVTQDTDGTLHIYYFDGSSETPVDLKDLRNNTYTIEAQQLNQNGCVHRENYKFIIRPIG